MPMAKILREITDFKEKVIILKITAEKMKIPLFILLSNQMCLLVTLQGSLTGVFARSLCW